MTRYTQGKPLRRDAYLFLNMNRGGGLEIWQFTDCGQLWRLCQFYLNSANSFDIGDAVGHFRCVTDLDGTLIEFIETHYTRIKSVSTIAET